DAAADHETLKRYLCQQLAETGGDLSESELDELVDNRLQSQSFVCPLRTLSQVIRETGVLRIDLLKVDVEKAELDVLLGLDEEDWPKVQQIVPEVHDLDGRLRRLVDLLEGHGFVVACEQDDALTGLHLYNLYARRPDAGRPAKPILEEAEAP